MSLPAIELAKNNPTHSLNFMLYVKNEILNSIYENDGEIDAAQENELTRLDLEIPGKVDAWAWLLMNNGGIDKEIELLADRKKAIEEVIQKLKNNKVNLKAKVHDIMNQHGMDRIDGNNFWLKKDYNRTSRVNLSKVEDEYKTFQLPKLSYAEYELVCKALGALNQTKGVDQTDILNLTVKVNTEAEANCGVKSLPAEHEAIETNDSMTIRIYQVRKGAA